MDRNTQKLSASLEDYLEAIYNIIQTSGEARVTDIATALGVQKASVSGALKQLAEKKLVQHKPYSTVKLTDDGKKRAENVLSRHNTLMTFLTDILGADPKEADKVACALEHALPKKMHNKLQTLIETLQNCPSCGKCSRAENAS